MKPETHRLLLDLRTRTDKEYGKLVQKLLAIALLDSGVERLTDRCIQGIDLELRLAGKDLALEVKTSEAGTIRLGKKDLEGLQRQLDQGAEAYVAVLCGGLLDEWTFARYCPGELLAGRNYTPFELRPYRDRELESRVRLAFEEAVARHAHTAAVDRQRGLDAVLATYPNRALA